MIRSIAGVVVGIVIAMALIGAFDVVNHSIYPPPESITAAAKKGDYAAVREAVNAWLPTAPLGALVLHPIGWMVGTFVGALAAAWIARRAPLVHALIVGAFPLLGTIVNLLMIPHPAWIVAAGIVGVPLAAIAAGLVAPRPKPASPRPYDMREKNMAC